jgi:hypothetical protein
VGRSKRQTPADGISNDDYVLRSGFRYHIAISRSYRVDRRIRAMLRCQRINRNDQFAAHILHHHSADVPLGRMQVENVATAVQIEEA